MRYPVLLLLVLAFAGCSTVYYSSLAKLGIEKRDVLVGRVEAARDAQAATKKTFATALEAFTDLTGYRGGDLEATSNRLNAAYQDSRRAAKRVSDRIDAVEAVAEALFQEWKGELRDYRDPALRTRSEQALRETRARYRELMAQMRRAEASMSPVLEVFEDRVLFLKHNLNARAVAGLDVEVGAVRGQVEVLVGEMEESIDEANRFISTLR